MKTQNNDTGQTDNSDQIDNRGIVYKYIVRRTDGSDAPGQKHHGCFYFVLDLTHDPHASSALATYALAVQKTRPVLSAELLTKLGLDKLVHEHDGKLGIAFSFPGIVESWHCTEDEAMRELTLYTAEGRRDSTGMHLVRCASWFPDLENFGEDVLEIVCCQWDDAVTESESFLDLQLDKDEQAALKSELGLAVQTVLRRHLKPEPTWGEEKFITWEEVDQREAANPAPATISADDDWIPAGEGYSEGSRLYICPANCTQCHGEGCVIAP